MRTISDLLNQHPFFAGFPPETLAVLAGCGRNVHYRTDEIIFTAGMPADLIYVLRRGKAAVELDTPRGGPLVIDTVLEGQILGVSWLLPPYRWTFDARAVEPTSAVVLDASCLRTKCDEDPVLGYELFKRFAGLVRDRLQATRLQLLDLYGNDAS